MIDNTTHKYQLVHVIKDDEYIISEWDILLTTNYTGIVNDSYNEMCLSDRKQTIVELREMIDEYNYNVIAEMDYDKELKNWFLKNAEREV